MIWGRTYIETHEANRKYRLWFAWRPVLLEDGRWAWLESIWFHKDVGRYKFYETIPKEAA